jgi:hypothetical protein
MVALFGIATMVLIAVGEDGVGRGFQSLPVPLSVRTEGTTGSRLDYSSVHKYLIAIL